MSLTCSTQQVLLLHMSVDPCILCPVVIYVDSDRKKPVSIYGLLQDEVELVD